MNKKDTDNVIPTLNQFKHCSQVLAYSLAQHREQCISIPLLDALPLISEHHPTESHRAIHDAGKQIYKEAMKIAGSSLAPASNTLDELRTQPRINVSSYIKLKIPATGIEWQGHLANISWGGLRIRTKELIGNADEVLIISLPYPEEDDIHIEAKIVRCWESEGMYSTAIRFSKLSQNSERKLNQLLNLLLNEDNDRLRKDIRFSQRVDVSDWDTEELKATLEDISKGGMMITMPEPIELDKSIKIQLEGIDEAYVLSLRARVIRMDVVSISDFKMYQMALKFEHPTEELRSMVHGLIQGMMNKGIMDSNAIPILN